jgi:Amidohydrolase/Starch/carbohydrate-binding module (family 53)
MKQNVVRGPTIGWRWLGRETCGRSVIAYRGDLSSAQLRVHFGFDGWQGPIQEVRLESVEPGLAVAEPPDLSGHVAVDCAVTDGVDWDNNEGRNYRLWVGFDALDAHLHVSGNGAGALGLNSLRTAMASAGMVCGVSSWIDNRALDRVDLAQVRLFPLVWIRPGETSRVEVEKRLAAGAVGLKLHPTADDYPADDRSLDPYLDIAAETGCPVACHSAPGDADPDHIRRLAERFPDVPIVLYHTYLGPAEGRLRAAQHVREQPNLYLETSWCQWRTVLRLIEQVGEDRVLFGSDASIDGSAHYTRHPPNVEGRETYNDGLVSLVRALGPNRARKVMGDNARRLFSLNGNSHGQ